MRILAIDSSAGAASAAMIEDDILLGEFYIHTKLTHSQTLMPMVDSLLKCAAIDFNTIDLFAVSAGPGSFTGVRIGVSAVKGMAMGNNKPCVGVSTLYSMAFNFIGTDCVVCAVMDARCNQVYNALFEIKGGNIQRLTEDRALSIDSLTKELEKYTKNVLLVGDGAKLCYNFMKEKLPGVQLAPEHLQYQRAFGVAQAAALQAEHGETVPAAQLLPVYLRLPQAERELKLKQQQKGEQA